MQEAQLVENAQAGCRREAVGAQTDDCPSFEQSAVRVRCVAEPRVRSGTECHGDPAAFGCGFGPKLPEVIGLEIGAVRDQPVGVAQLAAAHVVGRSRADRLPVVVPGTEIFQEAPERPVAVFEQAQLFGHFGQVGRQRRPAGDCLVIEPARGAIRSMRAQTRACAGGDLHFRTNRPQPSPGRFAGLEPAVALEPDQLGEDQGTQRGLCDRRPAQPGGRRVGEERGSRFDRGLDVASDGLFLRLLGPRPSLVDHALEPGNLAFIARGSPFALERLELEVRVRIDETGDDRDVSQVQITLTLVRRAHPGDSPALDCRATRPRSADLPPEGHNAPGA